MFDGVCVMLWSVYELRLGWIERQIGTGDWGWIVETN